MNGSKKWLQQLAHHAPLALRHWYIRQKFQLPAPPPPEVSVRIAVTQDDLEQAYRVLQLSYEEMGYAQPEPSGLRITKYFSLPTSTTLIVCWGKQVVGTMTVIRDGPFGTPLGQTFDLAPLVKRGWNLAEVSSLAIDPSFRKHRGQVLFPLCKYLYDYVRFYMQVDAIVIGVHPQWRDFYQSLLMFQPLEQRIIANYSFANGAPVVGLYLPLRQSQTDFRTHFAHLPPGQDLHRYMVVDPAPAAEFPERVYFKSQDPVMSAEMLEHFFVQKKTVLATLAENERQHLREQYRSRAAVRLFDSLWGVPSADLREARFKTRMRGVVAFEPVDVLNVSRHGLMVRTSSPLPLRGSIAVLVCQQRMARLDVSLAWQDDQLNLSGLRVSAHDAEWDQYLNYLETDLNFTSNRVVARRSSGTSAA